ncbi:MAG: hypothetical protein JNM13_00280 [Hyphomicrobiaceae bacterium]|nr:hypothetical protein [Hyphomicrobiaceae bacterium]
MAKGQKRSNKEVRKPKSEKPAAAAALASAALMGKGLVAQINGPKKKG